MPKPKNCCIFVFRGNSALKQIITTIMYRDQQIMERRDKAIFARFNQLLPNGKKYQLIYEQIGYEFYLSDERVKKIVLKMSLTRDKKSF